MKKQKSCSNLLSLALIVATSFGLLGNVWAQNAGPNTSSAIPDQQAKLVVQLGHTSFVESAAISADGKYVLTGGSDGTARLWEAETGEEVRQFAGHSYGVSSVAFSPDGKYVLTGSADNTARLWETKTGKEVRQFEGHSFWVMSVAFSPDGKRVLTGSADETARLWETETGKEVRKFEGHSIIQGDSAMSSVAFSPDGKYVLTGSPGKTVRLWQTETGEELREFAEDSRSVRSVAFSQDGKYILSGSGNYSDRACSVRLWEARTGRAVREFEGHSDGVSSVAFSPDGKYVITGSYDKTARLWQTETGKEVRKLEGHSDKIESVAFSPDGKYILTAGRDKTARLWEAETGKEVRQFEGHSSSVQSVAISADGKYVVTGSNYTARLWETESGKEVRQFEGHSGTVWSVAISADARYVLTGSSDNTARLWEIETGREVREFKGHSREIVSVATSADGKYVLTGSYDNTARLWETETGKEVREFTEYSSHILSVAISADSKYVLTGSDNLVARLWDAETGRVVREFEGHSADITSVAFSPDGKYVLTGSDDKTARLWQTETGKEVRRLEHSNFVMSIAFSPDSKYVLTAGVGRTARLWEVETGKEVREFEGHSSGIHSVAFSADGKYVLTGSDDSTTRFWDISTGKEVCQLISFRDGNWAVVAPDGRFDVSNLEDIKGLHWVMSDEPMKTYPPEIFMRDYYEPRLLPRILAGEQFKPVQSIATVNRVQPKVAIAAVTPQAGQPDLATVTVKVAKATGEFKQGDKKITRATGVYDLRLFRDGQLVAQLPSFNPSTNDATNQAGATPEQLRKAWREQARVTLDANGEQTITFKNIHLPRRADTKQVEFAAYAFNEDRVKSQTDRKSFEVPKDLKPVKGRAFVLTVGVNAHENSAWDLRFAVNDARLAQQALANGLKQSGEFSDVVNLSLISDAQPAGGAKPATKANFKAALAEIARQARPEDLVLIYYSSHGYADRNGNYYFFTSDTGAGSEKAITPQLLRHLISSDELSAWLKDVDAGEMTLIIDACQSAGTVKGETGGEFKPGPMGSRGLGQLAYDKGMRILAATQADDFAFEVTALQHGLLTYALMQDGIEARKADSNHDGRITLSEALSYALACVPKLFEALRNGELAKLFAAEGSRAARVIGDASSVRKKNGFQKPSLFDFAKKRREIVLVTH